MIFKGVGWSGYKHFGALGNNVLHAQLTALLPLHPIGFIYLQPDEKDWKAKNSSFNTVSKNFPGLFGKIICPLVTSHRFFLCRCQRAFRPSCIADFENGGLAGVFFSLTSTIKSRRSEKSNTGFCIETSAAGEKHCFSDGRCSN